MAVLVIMVIVLLGTTLAARTIANLRSVTHAQNFSGALANADAGVSDALFQIDQFTASNPAPSGGEFCVGTSPACANKSVPGAPGVQYKAVAISPTQWKIQALGTTHDVNHGVQALLTRSVLYPFALFGNNGMDFSGQASGGFSTYNSSSQQSFPNGAVTIGSNGPVDCSGGLGTNVTAVYYTGGGGISGGCGTSDPSSSRYNVAPPSAPSSALACPNGGLLGSNQGYATIAPGTYLCTGQVTLNGTLSVSPPGVVKIYDIWPNPIQSQNTTSVLITPGSEINYTTGSLPVASDFQILSNSQGNVGDSNGSGFTFGGVVYAPSANLTADGCKSIFYGSLTLNTFTCHGGPHLQIAYDSALSQTYSSWVASNYTEIPSSSISIP
ncbi:MAG: DUF7305 domain-containing protein [Acidimicrobiales bacterium]